jgi:integrase
MRLAVMLEYRESGIAGVKKLPVGERRRWSDQDIAYALENFPEHLRRAVVLALYTGQRSGDLTAMTWAAYDGEGINVKQQKTGVQLWLPCHPTLKEELDAWRLTATAVTILTTGRGVPFGTALPPAAHAAIKSHPQLHGLVFHGLRMTAAAWLAESGCTPHEIASITGHKTLAMIEHYTAGADQVRRAKAAIFKLKEYTSRY